MYKRQVTSLGIAQRDSLRDQMGWIRNRVAQMGVNLSLIHIFTFGNNITGAGSVRKTGTGLLKLTGANSGHLIVQEGNVQISCLLPRVF